MKKTKTLKAKTLTRLAKKTNECEKKGWQIIGQAYEYKSIFGLCWKIKLEKI